MSSHQRNAAAARAALHAAEDSLYDPNVSQGDAAKCAVYLLFIASATVVYYFGLFALACIGICWGVGKAVLS